MLNVILYHKVGSDLLEFYQEKWKRTVVTERDDEGELIEIIRGLHPKVAEVPFISVETTGTEKVQLFRGNRRDTPLFTLEGPKAKQLQVLEDYTKGLLKRR